MGNKDGVYFYTHSHKRGTQHAVDVGLIVVETIEALKCLQFFLNRYMGVGVTTNFEKTTNLELFQVHEGFSTFISAVSSK